MKKKCLPIAALTLVGILTIGAAAVGVQAISAQLRPDVRVVVNGVEQKTMTDVTGKQVYPISYDGTVYLPIRALGDVLSHDANWNSSNQTISLTLRERQRAFTTLTGAQANMTALEAEITALKGAATYELRAAQFTEYNAKLELFDDDLDRLEDKAERDFQLDLITYADYSTVNTGVDKLEVRQKTARATLAAKTIDVASSGTGTGTGTAVSGDYSTRISQLAGRISTEVKNVYNYKPAQNATSNKQALSQLETKLKALDREVDALDDELERAYKNGTLTREQYRALELALDRADDQLDAADDHLEDVLHYDDDDDWDDWDD